MSPGGPKPTGLGLYDSNKLFSKMVKSRMPLLSNLSLYPTKQRNLREHKKNSHEEGYEFVPKKLGIMNGQEV